MTFKNKYIGIVHIFLNTSFVNLFEKAFSSLDLYLFKIIVPNIISNNHL